MPVRDGNSDEVVLLNRRNDRKLVPADFRARLFARLGTQGLRQIRAPGGVRRHPALDVLPDNCLVSSLSVFDGLSVVEIVYGLDRLEACMPPTVSVPKPGPCPGSKRGAKKVAEVVKDTIKKTGQPKKATVKSTIVKKTAEPKAPESSPAKKTAPGAESVTEGVTEGVTNGNGNGSAPSPRTAGDAYTGPSFTVTPDQQKLIDERSRLKQRMTSLNEEDKRDYDEIWATDKKIDAIEARMPEHVFQRLRQEDMLAQGFEYMRTNVEDDVTPMPPEELRRKMAEELQRQLDGKKVAVRTTPLALGKILDDGRFKTQHETGKGGAVARYDPRSRKEFEAKIWGIPVTGFPNERRPVHGYVALHGIGPADDDFHLSQHGRVQVVLKDDVRNRTTAMIGDAVDQQTQARPSPLTALEHWSYNPAYAPRAALGDLELNLDDKKFRGYGYADAQIHDGVGLDDIEEVVFPEPPNAQLQRKLDAKGVSWRVIPSQADKD